MSQASTRRNWTEDAIRELVQQRFKKRACWFQIQVAKALYEGKDVVGCAPTGAGKTLTFWIPLLMALADGRDKMSFVITPLNILGKQNEQLLLEAGLPAVAVTKENANDATFTDIKAGKFRVIVMGPEIIMTNEKVVQWWKLPALTKRILNMIFDEGHCISQWSSFRKEYAHLGCLRLLIQDRVPFYLASATLPPPLLREIEGMLRLRTEATVRLLRSNDRPDIHLMVHPLVHPANSFRDLDFLVSPEVQGGRTTPIKFLVFFDNTKEAEAACHYLRSKMPEAEAAKLKYFHSVMTQTYREENVEAMQKSIVVGFCCTDAFGMGMDVSDIDIVVQYKATCDLCTLWQRFGRAARGAEHTATAILLVEKKDTRDEREAKVKRAQRKAAKKTNPMDMESQTTNKRKSQNPPKSCPKRKVRVLGDRNLNIDEPAIPNEDLEQEEEIEDTSFDVDAWLKERRMEYAKGEKSLVNDGRRDKGLVEGSAMDDFINVPKTSAGNRAVCRRLVMKAYMGNDRPDRLAPDEHILCDPTTPGGCPRCCPKPATICCDKCSPEFFQKYVVPAQKTSRTAAKSQLPKNMVLNDTDKKLTDALTVWRDERTRERFGLAILNTLGGRFFMTDDTIDAIVSYAHAGKITTVESITRETGWTHEAHWLKDHGQALLELVHSYYPPSSDAPGPKPAGQRSCSVCSKPGHNKATCEEYCKHCELATGKCGHNSKTCPSLDISTPYRAPAKPGPRIPVVSPQTPGRVPPQGKENVVSPATSIPSIYQHLRPLHASPMMTRYPYANYYISRSASSSTSISNTSSAPSSSSKAPIVPYNL